LRTGEVEDVGLWMGSLRQLLLESWPAMGKSLLTLERVCVIGVEHFEVDYMVKLRGV
jgi:hypothetical protein